MPEIRMYKIEVQYKVQYRNFPPIIISVYKDTDNTYTAESSHAFWGPGNTASPYRHKNKHKSATIDKAVNEILTTFTHQDNDSWPNDRVFVTEAIGDFEHADFFDGNGKKVTYDDAKKAISRH